MLNEIFKGMDNASELINENFLNGSIVEHNLDEENPVAGHYVRFGNRMQVCWKEYDLTGYNLDNPKEVFFPKEFALPPVVSHYIFRRVFDVPGNMTSRIGQPAPFSFKHAHQLQAITAVAGGYIAIGIW